MGRYYDMVKANFNKLRNDDNVMWGNVEMWDKHLEEMREHHPDLFAKTAHVLQSNSYIVYRLTGALTQDVSQGYGWHCYNMRRGEWDEAMAERLGIPPAFLPP